MIIQNLPRASGKTSRMILALKENANSVMLVSISSRKQSVKDLIPRLIEDVDEAKEVLSRIYTLSEWKTAKLQVDRDTSIFIDELHDVLYHEFGYVTHAVGTW